MLSHLSGKSLFSSLGVIKGRTTFCPLQLWFYLPSEIHVFVGTDGNCNFSAMRHPIGLKLGVDLGLVSQISVHILVSRFDCSLYCKQTKEQKNAEIAKIAVLQNLRFLSRAEFV
jgi:hypothetical protein